MTAVQEETRQARQLQVYTGHHKLPTDYELVVFDGSSTDAHHVHMSTHMYIYYTSA